jgi:ABC-type nitrate/sulfonate/bicarbonate transport system substrate-binding protein
LHILNLALNRYAFHWSHPEIAAYELGIFARNGVEVNWNDATPSPLTNKTSMYTDLLKEGRTDVYHAGEWACVNRVLKSPVSWIVAKSAPGEGTLNSSFALFVREESGINTPGDLSGKPIAIEEGTGAQFTTLLDLEEYLPRENVRLVRTGEPHRRLLALLRGEVAAASLLGPWSDIGRGLGLKQVLKTRRTNPTTIVARKDADEGLLRGFFHSVNEAIAKIDAAPDQFVPSYLKRVMEIVEEMELDIPEAALEGEVSVPKWNRWEPYTQGEFEATYEWMVERGLAAPGGKSAEAVHTYAAGVFS